MLQLRSVEFASKYNVPLRVLYAHESGTGTLIKKEEKVGRCAYIGYSLYKR